MLFESYEQKIHPEMLNAPTWASLSRTPRDTHRQAKVTKIRVLLPVRSYKVYSPHELNRNINTVCLLLVKTTVSRQLRRLPGSTFLITKIGRDAL
jgi:hypothetical protein